MSVRDSAGVEIVEYAGALLGWPDDELAFKHLTLHALERVR